MKKQLLLLAAVLAIAGSSVTLLAQDSDAPERPAGGPGGPGGPKGHRPPPVMAVLDANRDGVIDSAEIDNAPAALRKLDKNNDGSLTMEELRPQMRGGGRRLHERGAPADQQ